MSRGTGLLELGVRRPVGMLMVVVAAVVFGFVSLGKLPFDLLPDVDYPSLTVRTRYPGAAPLDLEERVTERLEDALSTVGGVVRMSSSSRAEVSEILLEFEWGAKLPFLVQDVRERLDRVFLPPGAERPLILRYDPSLDPVLRIAVAGGDDLVRLRDLAEHEIERELEGLPGVAAVKVRGGLEDEIQVRLDPRRLAAFRLTPEFVRQRLQDENLNVPGGKIEEGSVEYVVRTLNEFRSLEEIEDLPLIQRGGTSVKLRELAKVVRSHKDRDVILRVGGEEAVEVDVYREAGANLVDVADTVRERLFGKAQTKGKGRADEEPKGPLPLAEVLPTDLELSVLSDQSLFVRGAIDDVRSAALIGGLLAILVCYLFLRQLAVTAIIGLAIPISVIATFGAMYLAGVSLNVMSLGGLALGIGMLVDNTIVVMESISRCREEGDPPFAGALRGVREVGSAVSASTLTTIAVFAPIVFVEGIAGQIFGDQSLTVVASLLLSLAVALFFIPGLAARMELGESQPDRTSATPARAPARLPRFGDRFRAGPFRDLRVARPLWLWIPLSAAGLALAAWAGLHARQLLASFPESGAPRGADGELPKEVEGAVAGWRLLASVGLIPLLWFLGEALFVVLGRLASEVLALVTSLLRGLLLVVFAPLWLLLQPLAAVVERGQSALERGYPRLLRGALHAPVLVLLVVIVLAGSTWYASRGLGRELLPEVLQGEMTAELYFPSGTPLTETDRMASALEERLAALDGVVESACLSGADRQSVSTDEDGPHVAHITLRTAPGRESRAVERRVEEGVRGILAREPALTRFEIRRPTLLALDPPLRIEILGEDLVDLADSARRVQKQLEGVPGILDLRSSIRRGNPEIRVVLDRERLAERGLDLGTVARRLRLAVEGEVSSTFPDRGERIDIRVRGDREQIRHVESLRDLPVNPDAEHPLPLAAVAELSTSYGPSEIRHIGSRRAAVLSASLAGGAFNLGGLSDRISGRLANLRLPPGITVQLGGQKAQMDAALRSLEFALALAVFLVYAVMAAQFESLLQPFLILFSVPLAGIGAVWALRLTGYPLSVVALLGGVVLAGIVVNNAIVLVDRINRDRAAGMGLDEAILEASRTRLRPILMTTVTTVLGMIPLTGWLAFLGIGAAQGTELRAPMAVVVIAGLSASTLLTLVVIPVLYRLLGLLRGADAAPLAPSGIPSTHESGL